MMRSLRTLMPLAVALLTAQVLFAQYTAVPISQCPTVQPLAEEMVLCKTPRTLSLRDLNDHNLMVPMQMPVRMAPSQGRMVMQPLIITDTMPQDAVLMPLLVPVSVSGTGTQTCLAAELDDSVAGTMLLMPASVNGTTLMEPVQLKLTNGNMLMLPTSLDTAAGPTSVPMYVDGELVMFPLACRTTADGITLCPSCPADEITVLVRE